MMVPIFSLVVAISVAKKLDKVISMFGAIFGPSICLVAPAFIHLKLLAVTKCQRITDKTIIAIGLSVIIFAPISITLTW